MTIYFDTAIGERNWSIENATLVPRKGDMVNRNEFIYRVEDCSWCYRVSNLFVVIVLREIK